MSYLPYLLVILAGVLGWFHIYPLVIIFLAMVSTAILKSSYNHSTRNERIKVHPFVDLAYLYVLQILILFAAFALAYFLSTAITSVPGFNG